ncbi:hypothetical protein SAMN05216226_10488 [Halovenus aranensis]|uniref:Uncharacterized protein n=1 Tax=Halovenus aranensis TaxID=890420 RepID=A0A1G8U780_9EURY|nr:hypothetical protein [Halovenus aranensis]SDJ49591.1 hypothetical protein SAMN05216226_10488 [Halovenus aranensis]
MSTTDVYDEAVASLAAREYETAGDQYARAGWQILAEPRPERDPFVADSKGWVGKGLGHLVTSALCYRVAGNAMRATDRATEARAVATDFRAVLDHPAQQACLLELVADAHTAGDLGETADTYAEAVEAYREAGRATEDPQFRSTTPLFQAATTVLQQVARSTANGEIPITWDDLHGGDPSSPGQFLAHRAKLKRQRFPTLVESAVDDGYLAAPRGTTEYNNATYTCPACDATDVNWVGDSVLCMRCSTPMES